jgi:hypothetical protein
MRDFPPGADCEKTQAPPDSHYFRQMQEEREKMFAQCDRNPEPCGQIGRNYAPAPQSDSDVLAELFRYHPPTPDTLPKYAAINQAAKNFAEIVLANCPGSADRSAAIRLIRDARMTANASVALNGLSL